MGKCVFMGYISGIGGYISAFDYLEVNAYICSYHHHPFFYFIFLFFFSFTYIYIHFPFFYFYETNNTKT